MIVNLLKQNIEDKYAIYANLDENEQLLNALEWNWINGNKPMSTPYWADKVGMANLDNFIFALSKAGWIVSKANAYRKWGEFYLDQRMIDSLLTAEQQKRYRTKIRQKHYAMRYVENNTTDLVKTPKGYIQTGLVREGFAKCANQPFKLDTTPLAKYYDAVVANLTKSMDKVIQKYPTISLDETNYKTISIELLDYYIFNHDKTYNLEGNVSDSRGRAIYNALSRVGNPIASKDIRACLVVPTPKYISKTDSKSLKDIYLFIAELVGNKSKSWNAKALAGMVAYGSKALHELDLTTAEDRKHLHENIWLERMYHALDIINAEGGILWDIPIEIDATMLT